MSEGRLQYLGSQVLLDVHCGCEELREADLAVSIIVHIANNPFHGFRTTLTLEGITQFLHRYPTGMVFVDELESVPDSGHLAMRDIVGDEQHHLSLKSSWGLILFES